MTQQEKLTAIGLDSQGIRSKKGDIIDNIGFLRALNSIIQTLKGFGVMPNMKQQVNLGSMSLIDLNKKVTPSSTKQR